MDGLKECINLEILNLSYNDIKDLTVFRSLPKLQILNLSNNLIRSLEGLEDLEDLQMLNLSGNYIHNINEFQILKDSKELNQLKLVDKRKKRTNPLCSSNKNYIQDIHYMLPQIEIIDGENLKFQTPDKMLEQEDQYEKNSSKSLKIFFYTSKLNLSHNPGPHCETESQNFFCKMLQNIAQ